MATHVRVIVGNPPYSIGQKSANDNAQNLSYPALEKRIEDTYVKKSSAALLKGVYDSYIKAFRWASDRINPNEGGIIAFITNSGWLDKPMGEGFRRTIEQEFSMIYVLDLRGAVRAKTKENARREGGNVFNIMTGVAITILVKYPAHQKKEKCKILYRNIGDYLTREQKLKMIKDFHSIASQKLDWQVIVPNEKADWINQRDGVFDGLIPLAPEKKFTLNAQSIFSTYAIGVATNRDAWVSGFSKEKVAGNMQSMIDFYNQQIGKSDISTDDKKISWTVNLKKEHEKRVIHHFDKNTFVETSYRPFNKMELYYHRPFIERPGIFGKIFPNGNDNLVITLTGTGYRNDFSCLITNIFPNLHLSENGQCFPLYWYEENNNPQASLFDDAETNHYIRRDGITDWILKEVRNRFGGSRAITKEHIFYYVYGLLHSAQYRERFADDLKKSLPRIPIVDNVQDFMTFYKAGKELADLHLNYEQGINKQATGQDGDYAYFAEMPMKTYQTHAVKVIGDIDIWQSECTDVIYQHFAVEKMRFAKVRDENGKLVADKSKIIYNGHITIENIPFKAYEYIVNGKSAIEWIMERYAVAQDSKSLIVNDPNDWSKEHNKPRYILDLLLSVVNLSVQSVEIINSLPNLTFDNIKSKN